MLALVKTALLKPYTFIVLAIFICIVGPLAALRTPTDVFPDIGIAVIAVVWQYAGLAPDAMAGRVIYTYERSQQEAVDEKAAVDAANASEQIALNSYQAGAASYLEVVTAQTAALVARRQLQSVEARQVQASVRLVVALGGGWRTPTLANSGGAMVVARRP